MSGGTKYTECSPKGMFLGMLGDAGEALNKCPMRRSTDAHLLFILHLCDRGRISRMTLATETGLTDGCIRTALRHLRSIGMIETKHTGSVLTPAGEEFIAGMEIGIPDAKPSGIAEGDSNAVLLAHGKGHLMTDCLGIRDAAMKADAKGCIPFLMEKGKIRSPYYDSVGVVYPDLTGLAQEIGMVNGDAAVVCGADTVPEAYVAAFASMIRLLGC